MWSNVISPTCVGGDELVKCDSNVPSSRYKHGISLLDETTGETNLYVFGGRSGTFALKDFWRLNLNTGEWVEIKQDGVWPPRLQEHSIVGVNSRLYVFGGECHVNSDVNSHIWVWGNPGWEKIEFRNSGSVRCAPVSRRGHSCVLMRVDDAIHMVVYGGYRDLKGSLSDVWAFNIATNSWVMLFENTVQKPSSIWTNIMNYWNTSNTSNGYVYSRTMMDASQGPCPPPRHNHTSVMYNNKMYVYGGMSDLNELGDFWVFDFETKRWSCIKCIHSPGVLKGHSAIVVGSHMYIFGGETKGSAKSDSVWRFSFINQTFERLSIPGCRPCARVFASVCKLPIRKPRSDEDDAKPQPDNAVFRKSTSVVRFAAHTTYPSSSDYSSMETINYIENPNYKKSESFEMKPIGESSSSLHNEYVLLVGGLETHKSAVFKQNLVIWRLKLDCFCNAVQSVQPFYNEF